MDLSALLYQAGFRRTVAPGRGESHGQTVVGTFKPHKELGGGGPAELLSRYGLKLEPTAGSFAGEGRPDPSVVAQWLAGRGVLGGVAFLASALQAGLVDPKDVESLDAPDTTTTQDLMLISRNGQTSAYKDLLLPWLEETGGGQHPEQGEGVAGDPSTQKLAALEAELRDAQGQIDGLRERVSVLEGKPR